MVSADLSKLGLNRHPFTFFLTYLQQFVSTLSPNLLLAIKYLLEY